MTWQNQFLNSEILIFLGPFPSNTVAARMIKKQKMIWQWNEQHYWRSVWEGKERLCFESSSWKQN